MNADISHLGGLPSGLGTVWEDAVIRKRTEEYSVDCANANIFIHDEAFLDETYQVEMVNHSSLAHSDQSGKESTCSSLTTASDAVPVLEDEQSAHEYDDSVNNVADADDDDEPDVAEKRAYIDSVFFACDLAGTGTVAVSDIITYLSDTLHVSNYLHIYLLQIELYCT